MKLLPAALWLEQARADRKASSEKALKECHARYLLQQAYEKGLKALGIAILTNKQLKDKQFATVLGDYFLHHHTPMTVLSDTGNEETEDALQNAFPNDWERLLKLLRAFRFELKRRLLEQTDQKLERTWTQIDATRPSKNPKLVSYRYPFFDGDKTFAPANWPRWDDYQGSKPVVESAIDELLRRAGQAVAVSERS